MTLNEAKAVIYGNVVYACEKAGLAPQTTRLVQDACDTIIALADRKTEPQTVDWGKRKPCALELFDDDGNYIKPKTEPQSEYKEYLERIRPYDPHKDWLEDEPQTERSE